MEDYLDSVLCKEVRRKQTSGLYGSIYAGFAFNQQRGLHHNRDGLEEVRLTTNSGPSLQLPFWNNLISRLEELDSALEDVPAAFTISYYTLPQQSEHYGTNPCNVLLVTAGVLKQQEAKNQPTDSKAKIKIDTLSAGILNCGKEHGIFPFWATATYEVLGITTLDDRRRVITDLTRAIRR